MEVKIIQNKLPLFISPFHVPDIKVMCLLKFHISFKLRWQCSFPHTIESPTVTLHLHGKNITLTNGPIFIIAITNRPIFLAFACKKTSTRTKAKNINKLKIFKQNNVTLTQNFNLSYTAVLT